MDVYADLKTNSVRVLCTMESQGQFAGKAAYRNLGKGLTHLHFLLRAYCVKPLEKLWCTQHSMLTYGEPSN